MNDDRLPPVAPEVTATLVENLSPRLRKRLDAAVTKFGARPTHRDGDTVTIQVDDETELRLHAPGGVVATADAITCGCLLAPACVHRAAAACAAPTADPPPDLADRPTGAAPEPASVTDLGPTPATDLASVPDSASSPSSQEVASPAQRAAADALWSAGAAVLEAGIDGAGAVTQSALLRAAHTARIRHLPRAAGAALSVVTLLRAARAGTRPTAPPTSSRPWPNSWAPHTESERRPGRSWTLPEAARAARTARTAHCACTACSPSPWSPTRGTVASAPGSPEPTAASSRSAMWHPAASGEPLGWPTGPCAWGTPRSPTGSWAGPAWRSRERRSRRTADWAPGRGQGRHRPGRGVDGAAARRPVGDAAVRTGRPCPAVHLPLR